MLCQCALKLPHQQANVLDVFVKHKQLGNFFSIAVPVYKVLPIKADFRSQEHAVVALVPMQKPLQNKQAQVLMGSFTQSIKMSKAENSKLVYKNQNTHARQETRTHTHIRAQTAYLWDCFLCILVAV